MPANTRTRRVEVGAAVDASAFTSEFDPFDPVVLRRRVRRALRQLHRARPGGTRVRDTRPKHLRRRLSMGAIVSDLRRVGGRDLFAVQRAGFILDGYTAEAHADAVDRAWLAGLVALEHDGDGDLWVRLVPAPLSDRARALVVQVRLLRGVATFAQLRASFIETDRRWTWTPQQVAAAVDEAVRAGALTLVPGEVRIPQVPA